MRALQELLEVKEAGIAEHEVTTFDGLRHTETGNGVIAGTSTVAHNSDSPCASRVPYFTNDWCNRRSVCGVTSLSWPTPGRRNEKGHCSLPLFHPTSVVRNVALVAYYTGALEQAMPQIMTLANSFSEILFLFEA